MMERDWFEQFRWNRILLLTSVAFFIIISGCASANLQKKVLPSLATSNPTSIFIQSELSPTSVQAGNLVFIRIKLSEGIQEKKVRGLFEGIEVPFFLVPEWGAGIYASILGIPYERKPGPGFVTLSVGDPGEEANLQLPFQVLDGNYRSEVLHVDQKRVNPTHQGDLKRIQHEILEVKEIYKKVTPHRYWRGPFSFPIKSAITSPFGTRRVYNGQLKNFHSGLDLKAPLKTRVLSAASGLVVLAKDLFYTGNTVMIDHGYGIITLYAHMSRLSVKVGQVVQSHQLLGLSGKTGRVNGPHLHWQAVVHQVKVNPLGLIQVVR